MDSIRRERARSLKFVQIVFAVLALLSLTAALAVSTRGVDLGLPETSNYPIALAFLFSRRGRYGIAFCLGTHLPAHRASARALADGAQTSHANQHVYGSVTPEAGGARPEPFGKSAGLIHLMCRVCNAPHPLVIRV